MEPLTRRGAAEAALVASIAVFHVVDHELVHERWHVLTHASAGLVAGGAALALGATVDDLGWSPADAGRGLRTGGLLAAGILASFGVVAALPASDPLLADPRVDDARRRELARQALLDIPIGTAVYEELVFRSALLGLALRRFPPPVAVGVTSAIFGLWHVLPAIEDRRRDERVAARPVASTVVTTGDRGGAPPPATGGARRGEGADVRGGVHQDRRQDAAGSQPQHGDCLLYTSDAADE